MFILLPTSIYGCAIADICFNHNKSKNINELRHGKYSNHKHQEKEWKDYEDTTEIEAIEQ